MRHEDNRVYSPHLTWTCCKYCISHLQICAPLDITVPNFAYRVFHERTLWVLCVLSPAVTSSAWCIQTAMAILATSEYQAGPIASDVAIIISWGHFSFENSMNII